MSTDHQSETADGHDDAASADPRLSYEGPEAEQRENKPEDPPPSQG